MFRTLTNRYCGYVFEMNGRTNENITASWSVTVTVGCRGFVAFNVAPCTCPVDAGRTCTRGSPIQRNRELLRSDDDDDDGDGERGHRKDVVLDGSRKGSDKCLHDKCVSCV